MNFRDRFPLVGISLFVFCVFSLLIVQFFKIQIIEGNKWSRIARSQHELVVTEPFKRGLFYSNDTLRPGHPEKASAFVVDVPKFHLFIDPLRIPETYRQEIVTCLNRHLKKEGKGLARLQAQFTFRSHSRKLSSWLNGEDKDQILKWWFPFAKAHKIERNALYFIKDYQRSYPFGKLLGQVLHTIREDKEEKTLNSIPTGGLELIFDRILRGKLGKSQILRSPRHPLETGKILAYPEDGADVYLTINHHLQAIAEEEIEKAVIAAGGKAGWAILMHPRTGEVYALAQYPWFEPANYNKYFNDPVLQEQTKVYAVTDPFEPGSIMKPLTLVLALQANKERIAQGKSPLFSPQEKIATANGVFPGRSKPIRDVRRHLFLNMYMGLQKSSNIYMARLVQRIVESLGEHWYRNSLAEILGLGKKTGIELPSESPGLLPTPGKLHPNGKMEWSVPTPFSIAFGHNVLCNSFQMMRCYAMIANGGYDVKPTLLRKIVRRKTDGSEEVLLDYTQPDRIKQFQRLIDPEVVQEVVKAMKYVMKPGGSAVKADIEGYTEAGKTATSEKILNGVYSKKNHISSCIGFAPADSAAFVLMVVIDEPEFKYVPGVGGNQFGGTCAAPAFRQIGLRTLQYLGVEPDDPYGYPVGDIRRNAEKADWFNEVKQLAELYKQWNSTP